MTRRTVQVPWRGPRGPVLVPCLVEEHPTGTRVSIGKNETGLVHFWDDGTAHDSTSGAHTAIALRALDLAVRS